MDKQLPEVGIIWHMDSWQILFLLRFTFKDDIEDDTGSSQPIHFE